MSGRKARAAASRETPGSLSWRKEPHDRSAAFVNSDSLAGRIENLLGSPPSSRAGNPSSKPPPPIPDHEIIARIGRGSYGEVWLARSVTGALRAVKVVWRSSFAS